MCNILHNFFKRNKYYIRNVFLITCRYGTYHDIICVVELYLTQNIVIRTMQKCYDSFYTSKCGKPMHRCIECVIYALVQAQYSTFSAYTVRVMIEAMCFPRFSFFFFFYCITKPTDLETVSPLVRAINWSNRSPRTCKLIPVFARRLQMDPFPWILCLDVSKFIYAYYSEHNLMHLGKKRLHIC